MCGEQDWQKVSSTKAVNRYCQHCPTLLQLTVLSSYALRPVFCLFWSTIWHS